MYGYTRLNSDGSLMWVQKQNVKAQDQPVPSFDNIVMATLTSCDVKTNVQYETLSISQSGTILRLINIRSITSWQMSNNLMTIYSEDDMPLTLAFISATEAMKADFRLYMIVNGAVLTGCGDEVNYRCTKPVNPTLTFI